MPVPAVAQATQITGNARASHLLDEALPGPSQASVSVVLQPQNRISQNNCKTSTSSAISNPPPKPQNTTNRETRKPASSAVEKKPAPFLETVGTGSQPVWLVGFKKRPLHEGIIGSSIQKILDPLLESQSKPGIKMVDPEPCKEIQRRPQLFMAGIVPY